MGWLVDNSVDKSASQKPIKKMIAKNFECNTEFGDSYIRTNVVSSNPKSTSQTPWA